MDRDKIQDAIMILLEIHEDEDLLYDMASTVDGGGLRVPSQAQGQIANVVRFLMHLRDRK